MAHDNGISNQSTNRPFVHVLEARASRRRLLSGGIGLAATAFFAPPALLAQALRGVEKTGLIDFTPVPVEGGGGLAPRIAPEYEYQVILPWGEPIFRNSMETIGIGHDGMHYFPLERIVHMGRRSNGNEHGLLVVNNEFGDNAVVIGKDTPAGLADVRKSQFAHGVSVVEILKTDGVWEKVNMTGYSRRIHVNTPVEFSGPAAGSALLQNPAGNKPAGTVNNCANGVTPWGTYLTCEENFNGYFGRNMPWTPSDSDERYGFAAEGFGYGWHLFDARFDLGNPAYMNERNRFGWIVEIDPMRPWLAPVKRTALGRFKHEGVALVEGGDGRVVGYMGDDERFDYIYKFVSERNWREMIEEGLSPLDSGKLYAARFNDDGSGDWLELTIDNPDLAAQFSDQAEVLVYARQAADILGATPMDRPEWTSVAPNGLVYCTLTNNSRRESADAANPLAPNPDGHIIRWLDGDRHLGLSFEWDIFLVAGHTHGTEDAFGSPDGLWADPDGRIFIQTDGRQPDGLNDQMLVADTYTGEVKRLFEGVRGAEVTGIATTPDRRTMFVNLQHPNPDTTVGRDSTIVITRKDGGIVGS